MVFINEILIDIPINRRMIKIDYHNRFEK